jgi:hypothetical protein
MTVIFSQGGGKKGRAKRAPSSPKSRVHCHSERSEEPPSVTAQQQIPHKSQLEAQQPIPLKSHITVNFAANVVDHFCI